MMRQRLHFPVAASSFVESDDHLPELASKRRYRNVMPLTSDIRNWSNCNGPLFVGARILIQVDTRDNPTPNRVK